MEGRSLLEKSKPVYEAAPRPGQTVGIDLCQLANGQLLLYDCRFAQNAPRDVFTTKVSRRERDEVAGGGDSGRTALGRGMAPWLAGFGAVAGAGAALGSYALLYEPFDVRAEQLTVRLMRDRRGLPDEGLRILHISDTHFRGADRREHAKIERVRRATADAQFDLLIHTGDFLHNDEGLENVLALIDSIPRPRIGAFAVTGNHDHVVYEMRKALHYSWRNFRARAGMCCDGATAKRALTRRGRLGSLVHFARYLLNSRFDGEPSGVNDIAGLRRALEGRGVQFLDNRSVRLEGTDTYLVGIEDLLQGEPDLKSGLQDVPPDTPTILLSHNPDVVALPASSRADLILAGHTHGGQIVLPLLGPVYTQTEQLTRSEASGHWRRRKTHVYVHRGLGESIPIRLGSPPHVTFLTLLPARSNGATDGA